MVIRLCVCFFLSVFLFVCRKEKKRISLSLLFSLCVMNVNVNVIDVNNGFEWGRNGLGSLVSLSLMWICTFRLHFFYIVHSYSGKAEV